MSTRVFFLYPVNGNDVAWPIRPYTGSCLVYAGDEDEARQMAERATSMDGWLDPKLSRAKEAQLVGDPPPEGYRAAFFDDPRERGSPDKGEES